MHFSSIIITNTGWLLDKPRERARAKTHSGPRRLILASSFHFHSFSPKFPYFLLRFFTFLLSTFALVTPNTVSFLTNPILFSLDLVESCVCVCVLFHQLFSFCLWQSESTTQTTDVSYYISYVRVISLNPTVDNWYWKKKEKKKKKK